VDFLLHPSTDLGKIGLMVFAIAIFAVAMGLILLLLNLPKHAPKWLNIAGFLGPVLVMVSFGLVYPALVTINNSFKNKDSSAYIGLDNYQTILSTPDFLIVLRNTVFWVLLVPTLSTIFGLVYAALVDRTRVEKLAKTLMFMPMAISMVGASIIWKFVYDNKVGTLSRFYEWVLGLFGAENPQAPQWLMNGPWNNFFLIIVMIWIQAGFAMTVLSAAIKAIPEDVIESARIDGVGGYELFRFITVPMIRPSIVVVLTTVAMTSLKAFDVVRTMTGGQFGTSVVANEFYTQSFNFQNTGLGAALAVLLFIIIIPVIVYNVRQLKASEDVR
jgi:alpha-glucoside transport system permease protein